MENVGEPQPLAPSDGALVRQAVAGRRQAFDELIRRYQRQAVGVSYRLLGRQEDALEVTQDAFLKAYTNLSTLEAPEAFGGWLMRIVSNLSLNYRRSRKNKASLSLDDEAVSDAVGAESSAARAPDEPSHLLAGRELGEQLKAALEQLPERQRLALVMFTLEQMPQKLIAETLQCTVEAVKWHVFQGRKRLREMLKDQLED